MAALHAYAPSSRHRLGDTSVEILEMTAPLVAVDPLEGPACSLAMPLGAFVQETLAALPRARQELVIERVASRDSPRTEEHEVATCVNEAMADI